MKKPDDISIYHSDWGSCSKKRPLVRVIQAQTNWQGDFPPTLIQVWYCPECGAFDHCKYEGDKYEPGK